MSNFWMLVVGVLAGILGFFTAYQLFFGIVSLPLVRRSRQMVDSDVKEGSTRFAVVIPAHNEELLIQETVQSLKRSHYPQDHLDVVVVADNCVDRTAPLARESGAICLVREDLVNRGKPYALAWAFQRMDLTRYDAIVIVDGDTAVDPDFLRAVERRLARGEQALQGYYGVMNPDENWVTRLGTLPAVLKFRLHVPAKLALGLSCPLAGNGMVFNAEIIRQLGWNAFSITENWEYYVILTLRGYRVTAAPEAMIYAQLARTLQQGEAQRMRWMKGRLDTAQRYGGDLLWRGLTEPSLVKLDALIEVLRPTHAMLFLWSMAYMALTMLLWLLAGWPLSWAVFATVLVVAQLTYFLAGFAVERPPLRTWLALAMVPGYIAWKLLISIRGLATLRDKRWIKTARHGGGESSSQN
jgi:1,2-diacylglycerol 3-beta-glucosyltransferase